MDIKFTSRAIKDIDEIYDYLVKTDECVAQSVLSRIENCIDNLSDFPEIGKDSAVNKTKEIKVSKLPYIIIYEIIDNIIFILIIFHTSRDPDMKFFV